jgi:hypothetical protein
VFEAGGGELAAGAAAVCGGVALEVLGALLVQRAVGFACITRAGN